MVLWTWSLGAAAAAIGAVILVANSPLLLLKRPPFNLRQLEQAWLKYMDGSDRIIRAKDLWSDRGAVIMVEAQELSSLRPELDKLNVPLYGIVHETRGAKEFHKYLQGDILLDEKKVFYGDTRINLLGLLRFSSMYNYNIASSKVKGNLEGDGTLPGSSLVIGPGDQGILFEYRSKEFSDHADPKSILEAAQKINNH